ncbi:HNH endonuclease [Serratia phage SP1]|nr:HNH endonuclease [Serratia phage SP1]
MNYSKIYDSLIERARDRALDCYTESHHIVPRCMGGSDDKSNLVDLTPEEHYVAHQLLVKIHPGNGKLIFAAIAMAGSTPKMKRSNKTYGWLKRKNSKRVTDHFTGMIYYNDGSRSIKIREGDTIPDGFVKGRHYSPTTGKRGGPKGSDTFSNSKAQSDIATKRWKKHRNNIMKECGYESMEDFTDMLRTFKNGNRMNWKPLLTKYPVLTKGIVRGLIYQ